VSNEERARILRMVAEGKLSAEEAADLLEALEPAPRPEIPRPLPVPPSPAPPNASSRRVLRIEASEGGDTKINVRIPLSLARAAGRFIPKQAQRHLAEYDIDLEQLLSDLGTVAVDGPLVEIQDDDEKLFIAVE
jgi:hypothetical protein